MKQLTILTLSVIAFTFSAGAFAQTPDIQDFTVNGIRVVMRSSANQVVAAGVAFTGGYGYGETDNPYLPTGMIDVTTASGSAKYPKDKFRSMKERMVTTISGTGDYYGVRYWLRCVKPNLTKSWDMFSDVILHPLYDSVEWNNTRDNEVNDINQRHSSPDQYAYFAGDSIYRSTNPRFGRVVEIPDVQSTTIAFMKQLHDALLQRQRMLVVIVGNVSREEITKMLQPFADLPTGAPGTMMDNKYTPPSQSELFADNRPDIPTTYVYGITHSPDPGQSDYWASRLTSQYLSERFFEEVRTKRNLSYAPFCFVMGTMHNYRFLIGVSSVHPDSAVGVELNEIKKVQNGDIDKKTFEDEKNVYITEYYQRKMTNMDQAQELYTAIRETGDWHYAYKINDILNVTPADAQAFATKYIHNILYSISGDKSKTTENKFLFN